MRQMWGRCSRICNDVGLSKSQDRPWSSPVILVWKNSYLLFCVDYRKLNYVTRKDCFPLPQIDITLDTLAGTKWFPALDWKSSYWQVDIHLDNEEKTASSTGQGP
jgi:hypothetical protein